MLRFWNVPNGVTMTGLLAAVACAMWAVHGRIAWAAAALIVSGLCDFFDGFLARRMRLSDEGRRFGARLDSLVDACSFGFAPVFLLHAAGSGHPMELALLAVFLGCAVWRLAYFDTVGLSEGHYVGLPTTYVALVLPLAFLAGFAGRPPLRIAADAAATMLAVAMVAPVRVAKPGGVWYGIFLVLGLGLAAVYVALAGRFA
ncbi:MAG: CDP-alcohol phosphatidyltransferase family protein [Planctomycetes bacterium]|nr:CDP-alcohol phosphatidyltransferase family protein [Planctomycetota bacterium]